LSDDGYKWNENKTYKSKEFLWEKAYAKSDSNQEGKIRVISWWSADFDRSTKHERGDIEEKMNDFINNPSKLNASNA
jgi:pyocin large subunit-like protein